jgi:hypothetical protein
MSGNAAAGQCAGTSGKCAGGAIAAFDKTTVVLGQGCSLVHNRYAPARIEHIRLTLDSARETDGQAGTCETGPDHQVNAFQTNLKTLSQRK